MEQRPASGAYQGASGRGPRLPQDARLANTKLDQLVLVTMPQTAIPANKYSLKPEQHEHGDPPVTLTAFMPAAVGGVVNQGYAGSVESMTPPAAGDHFFPDNTGEYRNARRNNLPRLGTLFNNFMMQVKYCINLRKLH